MKIELDNGKYTYVFHPDGRQHALRYGQPWRDLLGDKFVYCMACKIEELESSLKKSDEALDSLVATIQEILDGNSVGPLEHYALTAAIKSAGAE